MTKIKTFFILFLFIIYSTTCQAQVNKFNIGIEGGPSIIFMRGNEIIKSYQKASIGYSGGIFFQYNFKKILSLRTSISYERKGSVSSKDYFYIVGASFTNTPIKNNFKYLSMPILLRATFGKGLQYFVNAGPYFGYLIQQNFTSEELPTRDNTSVYKRLDLGLSLGLGLIVPIRKKFSFSFEVRNNLGLFDTSDAPVYGGGTIKTNSTVALLGFAYKFGLRE